MSHLLHRVKKAHPSSGVSVCPNTPGCSINKSSLSFIFKIYI